MYATLETAFGIPPAAYFTGYWVNGVVLIEGEARNAKLSNLFDGTGELEARTSRKTLIATDNWPFLYLTDRSIPGSVLVSCALFLLIAWIVLRKLHLVAWKSSPSHLHFFLLGTGFLLLETKAVMQLSLLFGGTWIVNTVVIGAFLVMALSANGLVSVCRFSVPASYALLLAFLIADFWFPYSRTNALGLVPRLLAGGGWAALPVFFSGIVFSTSLQRFGTPAEMLGINLFGAVLGGVLENTVMIGGASILKVLVFGIYALSALALFKSRRLAELDC